MGKDGGLFRYADCVDKLLIFLGTLGCIGDGLMTPLNMFILSSLIDDYGGAAAADASFTNTTVDKVLIILVFTIKKNYKVLIILVLQ